MDNFIVRWYNQNRKMIWIVVLTIVGVIALIQTLNNYYKNNPKYESSSTTSTTAYNANKNYSIITQEKIDETTSEESIDLIEDFFTYCNNGQIEYAYNLISKECKEELYPTLEDFKTKYYNRIFTEQKSYESTLWITTSSAHTYRIEIMPDLLATGKKDSMPIEEYFTITNEGRLCIGRFINKKDINNSISKKNVVITVETKTTYMDYEIYKIKVKNNTGKRIIFNTKENTDSIYLQDENNLKYIAFLNEIPDNQLQIYDGETKTLDIKFNRKYKPTINIQNIVFEDININGQLEKIEIYM